MKPASSAFVDIPLPTSISAGEPAKPWKTRTSGGGALGSIDLGACTSALRVRSPWVTVTARMAGEEEAAQLRVDADGATVDAEPPEPHAVASTAISTSANIRWEWAPLCAVKSRIVVAPLCGERTQGRWPFG